MHSLALVIPHVDYKGLSPLMAVAAGTCIVLMAGLFRGRFVHQLLVPLLTIASLGAAIGLTLWVWEPGKRTPIVAGELSIDTLALGLSMLFYISGIVAVLLAMRGRLIRSIGGGDLYALLLGSIAGMVVLASAESLLTLFVGIELLSIPLYVLCGSRIRSERSLEAGLKYLGIGSGGSARPVYGLALIYLAPGTTGLGGIAAVLDPSGPADPTSLGGIAAAPGLNVPLDAPLLLTGIGFSMAGLAFKPPVAPCHTWPPDVSQRAPPPTTAFMAVATKAPAPAIIIRFFD